MGVRVFYQGLDKEIPLGAIKQISLSSDMLSSVTTAVLSLQDMSSSFFNLITLGSLINIKIDYNNEEYITPFRIVSFNKTPKKSPGDLNKVDVFLLHSWYFQGALQTQAYTGSISEITNAVLSGESLFNLDIFPTADKPATRYRIAETKKDFLDRISKYAVNKNNPVYLFMDLKNTLHLQGIADMKTAGLSRCAVSKEALSQYTFSNEMDSYKKLMLAGYNFKSNLFGAHSSSTTRFPIMNFKTTGEPLASNTVYNYEASSPQSDVLTPKEVIYSHWNKTPMDAAAIAARKAFEKNLDSFYAIATFNGMCLDESVPGTLIKLLLAGDTKQAKKGSGNLGEDIYIVQKSQIVIANNTVSTKLQMIPVASPE